MNLEEILASIADVRQQWHEYPVWWFELGFWVLVALIAIALIRLKPAWMLAAESAVSRIAAHRRACLIGTILVVILVRLALLPLIPVPIPSVHDECSYLLGADTFASGRVTNPTHPMWVYFETFHVNMIPTYQSMYPPAQAAFLALGQLLTGVPWVGVLLSTALMCGALCWMFQEWLPPQWALLGTALVVLRYGILSYWMNSYFGGSVAALGGALLLACLPRLRRGVSIRYAILFAVALVLLATSRPLEGFIFSVPITAAALYAMWHRKSQRRDLLSALGPAIAILVVAFAGLLFYNWRSTGSAKTMPYVLNHAQYHITKPFLWQSANPIPEYRHKSMRALYATHELPLYLLLKQPGGLAEVEARQTKRYYTFLIWPGLVFFLIAWRFAVLDPQMRVVALSVLMLAIILMLQVWPAQPHYAAPALGAILLVVIDLLRRMHRATRFTWMPWVVRSYVLLLCALVILPLSHRFLCPYGRNPGSDYLRSAIDRQRFQNALEAMPGKHLVIVHYPDMDNALNDWIYNSADIDRSKVVWARDIDGANESLVSYFSDRQVWYVDRGDPLHKLYTYQFAEQRKNQFAHLALPGSTR